MLSEDYTAAVESIQAGLELLGDVQDAGAQSTCLGFSSMVLIQTGLDLDGGLRNAERAVELQQSAEDPLGLALALVNLAVAAMLCERFDLLDTAYGEFLTIPRACEHARLRTWAEQAAAWAQVTTGSPERALEHADRGLALEGEWPSMTHFQVLSFRIHALAKLGRTDQALTRGSGGDAPCAGVRRAAGGTGDRAGADGRGADARRLRTRPRPGHAGCSRCRICIRSCSRARRSPASR